MSSSTNGQSQDSPPAAGRLRSIPRSAVIRFALLVAFLAIAFALFRWTPLNEFLTKDRMVALMMDLRSAWWAPLALLGLYLVLSPTGLPVSPLIFAGGVVFGVKLGWLYNFLGTMLGASASFLLARALGYELVSHVVPDALLQRAEKILEKHGFWAIVRVRFLPIPFAVINYGAALAGVRFPPFLAATAIGLVPSMLIYTYFGHALFNAATADRQTLIRNLAGVLILVMLLTFLVPLRKMWKKRRYKNG
ncbi:MAG: hypothetical protein GWP16_02945 [Nitrospirae bacterium]|nr:hypothetical protein [Nitrospirota bacterium]